MIGGHNLRRRLEVWRRPAPTRDSVGGRAEAVRENIGAVWAKVSQSTAEEQTVAAQTGANHTHTVHLRPDADVQRGDELVGDGDNYDVIATVKPSTPIYLRANVERRQTEPGAYPAP